MTEPTALPDLELRALTKSYGSNVAVSDFDLEVAAGEFVVFLGPSGCGKTTTLRMIAGFVQPTSGEIRLGGADVTHVPPHRRNMGMVFQNYALFPHMTVRKNIEFGLNSHRFERREVERKTGEVLELVGLTGYQDRLPRELSGGQQQRVAVARVLALKPRLLLFDEPLSNLDAKLRVQMRYEIRRLQREVGVTALFVTHDQEEAMALADRIVVLNQGRVEQVGTAGEIYDRPNTRFVADFIGSSNSFEGEAIDGADGPAFRAQSGVVIPLPADAQHRGVCVLSVRPEKLELRGKHATTRYAGRIVYAIQLGAIMEYLVTLDAGDTLRIHEQRRSGVEAHNVGDTVSVSWAPESTILLTR